MNPYQTRRLARRLHEDRAKRIETLLVRLAADGTLSEAEQRFRSDDPDAIDAFFGHKRDVATVYKVLSHGYVWCDVHCEVHGARENFYNDRSEYCERENWRPVFVASTEPDERF